MNSDCLRELRRNPGLFSDFTQFMNIEKQFDYKLIFINNELDSNMEMT